MDLNSNNLELCYEFNEGIAAGNNTGLSTTVDSKGNINGNLNGFGLTGTTSNFVAYSQNAFGSISPSICGGSYTSPSGNYTWSTTGIYTDTLVGITAGGCDSIITIDLTVGSVTNNTTINPQICNNYISPSGNYIWTASGTYTDTLLSVAGCDSIITINLTILNSAATLTTTACGSYTLQT